MEITFVFVKRVVLVDILHVGHASRTLIERVGSFIGRERVPFNSVVAFVTFENRQAFLVIVISAEEVVVVAGRVIERREYVVLHPFDGGGRQFGPEFVEVFAIGRECEFVGIRKSVETYILHCTRT